VRLTDLSRLRNDHDAEVEIRILVENTVPPSGTVRVADTEERPFGGWLQLLAILETAISGPQRVDQPDQASPLTP
jgi:hypothetical protein